MKKIMLLLIVLCMCSGFWDGECRGDECDFTFPPPGEMITGISAVDRRLYIATNKRVYVVKKVNTRRYNEAAPVDIFIDPKFRR